MVPGWSQRGSQGGPRGVLEGFWGTLGVLGGVLEGGLGTLGVLGGVLEGSGDPGRGPGRGPGGGPGGVWGPWEGSWEGPGGSRGPLGWPGWLDLARMARSVPDWDPEGPTPSQTSK